MEVRKRSTGFTIIEMLVVVSALALIFLISSNLFISTLLGGSKVEILKEVRQNGGYALLVIEETIKNSYDLVSCGLNSIILKDKYGQNITFEVLNDEEGIPRIASNGGYLTSNKVRVRNFSFNCGELVSGSPTKVEVSFLIEQAQETDRPERKASMSFSTTAVTRSFYQEKLD